MANSIMVDLDDPRTEKIADVISNKTSKKILGLLAEKELSESEIANSLGMPLNTVGYNIDKLEEVGLIEKVKGFLWSVKGKRIHKYRVSNRKIIISPKNILKGIIPSVLISGALALGIKAWIDNKIIGSNMAQETQRAGEGAFEKSIAAVADNSASAAGEGINHGIFIVAQNGWLLFFAGALFGLLVFLIWNSMRSEK